MSTYEINRQFARALGLPRNTTKATLTLEVGKDPTIAVECFLVDGEGRYVHSHDAEAIRKIAFKYRLEPFEA